MGSPVASGNVSKVVGYLLTKGDFRESSPNLPQRVAVFAEANTANQGTLDLTPKEITTEQQAGNFYGFGSPAHRILSILKPSNGNGIAVPVIVYPQAEQGGATAKIFTIEPTGVATKNGIHYLVIAGRDNIKGQFYQLDILEGDTVADVTGKIEDAINAVLGSPVTATSDDYEVEITTKWKGLTANDVTLSVDTNDDDLGLTYSINATQAGAGTPSVVSQLANFKNEWNTIVVNSYTAEAIMSQFEAFNGIADPDQPSGRYSPTTFKPFIAITGSVIEDPSTLTDDRENEMTIAIAPAPLSPALPMEAAANMAFLFATQAQDSPHTDVSGQSYPDMPIPSDGDIGDMAEYVNRDAMLKAGSSTVDLVSGKYKVMDFATTYHPEGEEPPQFRYCRNINIDWNVRYTYFLSEQLNLVDHAIVGDDQITSVKKVVKPKIWKGIVKKLADDLSLRALIVEKDFMKDSITCAISGSNSDRLDTFFRYKRSGFARISATEAQAGFHFGTLNT